MRRSRFTERQIVSILKELESELSQYKKMYAELARENYALKELIERETKCRN